MNKKNKGAFLLCRRPLLHDLLVLVVGEKEKEREREREIERERERERGAPPHCQSHSS
jgi:hypothetical protein